MPDAPEIPEAKDPFEKQVAISIAALAVALSVIGNKGDNAKTDAIIQTNEAANQWAYYQAKGIKGSVATSESEMLTLLAPAQIANAEVTLGSLKVRNDGYSNADIAKTVERLKADVERYKTEQGEIQTKALQSQKNAERGSEINDRCDMASLALQIAIVIASVSILSRWRLLWFIALALGAVGTVIGISAFRL